MAKVIRGYWDCPSCGKKGIDGLLDACPNCGRGKDKSVHYYMKSASDTVTDAELEAARIGKDELDGKHKDWLCAYCGYLNRFSDKTCRQCGAPKEEKEGDYGDNFAADEQAEEQMEQEREEMATVTSRSRRPGPLRFLPLLAGIFLLFFLFFPFSHSVEVTGFSWEREVDIETYQTVEEHAWDLPAEGKLLYTKEEFSHFQSVLDHYETELVTHYRSVLDHYETYYEYRDNGNGTFSEVPHQEPVYRDEPYQVQEQVPIYVQVPVYATMYYYEVDKWIVTDEKVASGNDHSPYWPEYRLRDRQRDERRREEYLTYLSDGSTRREEYDTWEARSLGDSLTVKKSLAGITLGGE